MNSFPMLFNFQFIIQKMMYLSIKQPQQEISHRTSRHTQYQNHSRIKFHIQQTINNYNNKWSNPSSDEHPNYHQYKQKS